MRIVGGRFRGRRIAVPKDGVRPTSERVREALMSMLGPNWSGRYVLDCYAGSGAFGFETLSWGASHVTYIERDARTAQQIRMTADQLGVSDCIHMLHDDATRALRTLSRQKRRFDLLFFDPPYADSQPLDVLSSAVGLAKDGAALVWESAATSTTPEHVGGWQRRECRRYGSTAIAVYESKTGGT